MPSLMQSISLAPELHCHPSSSASLPAWLLHCTGKRWQALVPTRGNCARGDGRHFWVCLLDKGQEAVQILHLISLGVLVHQALCGR
jgi:hypothetical protein